MATDELAAYANHQLGQAAKQEHARNAHQMGLLLHIQGCKCAGFKCNTATEMVASIFEAPSDDVLVETLKTVLGNGFVKISD
jgi:hypothetical protein